MPAIPITRPPAGTVACLRTPASNSVYGPVEPLGDPRETASISRSSSGSTTASSPAARARSSTVRSSWVGPSPPEVTSRSASRPSRIASSSSAGSSPTTVIRAGSSPSRVSSSARNGPFASPRVPRTSSLPVTRTADRRLNRSTGRARRVRRDLEPAADARAGSGHDARPAVELQPQVRRGVDVDPEVSADEPLLLAALEGSRVDRLARARAAADDEVRATATPDATSCAVGFGFGLRRRRVELRDDLGSGCLPTSRRRRRRP